MLKKKEPGKTDDELMQKLRAAVRKRRPWTVKGILLAIALIVIPAGLFVWWMFPRPEPPRLTIVAFDQLAIPGEEVNLHAQLEAVLGDLNVNRGGYPVHFDEGLPLDKKKQHLETTSLPDGQARAVMRFAEDKSGDFSARYIGDKKRRGAGDRARVYFWPAETRLVVVDVQHVLSPASAEDWRKKNILDIAPVAGAGKALADAAQKKYRIVYLATYPDSALGYRKMRGWVENHFMGKEPFPPGPVLGRTSCDQEEGAARHEILSALKERYRDVVAVVGKGEAAAVCQAVGARTFLIGQDHAPEETIRVMTLADVAKKLTARQD